MTHYCTHCDYNYLLKGLALHHSLCTHHATATASAPATATASASATASAPFTLHWLCNDAQTAEKLFTLNLPNVQLYTLAHLEAQDAELLAAKSNPPSKYGTQHSQYMWCLTPYFMWYLLHKQHVPAGQLLTYIDADIQFYASPLQIHDKIADASVGIHTHRFSKWIDDSPVGNYNVGIVVLRNNYPGNKVAEHWKQWMLTTTHQYYEQYGTCGDQKYLELFNGLILKDDFCVFDNDAPFTHLAPWCTGNDEGKPVLFYHFSHFVHDIKNNTWRDHVNTMPEWRPSLQAHVRPYYEAYFELIKQLNERYKIE